MKGTVLTCLREIVVGASDEATWRACLEQAGFDPFTLFTLGEEVPDARAIAVIHAVCTRLGLTLEQAGDAFGGHWVGSYAPRLYAQLYARYRNARELFTSINEMHDRVTKHIPSAKPPRFRLEWTDATTLLLHYDSHRGLIDVAVGMARAMGRHYGEELVVTKLSPRTLRVVFPTAA